MRRRKFLYLTGGLAGFAGVPGLGTNFFAHEKEDPPTGKMLGMYVHRAWPYKHPYAARTWTVEDFRGYAQGLKRFGYNTLVIWPVIEIMPSPLTPSDRASLKEMAKVIDMLHGLGFRAYMTLCPNIVVDNEGAAKYPYERRYYFHSLKYVDPADSAAVKEMVKWREELLRPLAKMDGCAIIDSDTGSYPGATNDQFVSILIEHRRMFDRLRPGIELLYWMHVGWEGYGRYLATGKFAWGTREETRDVLAKLKKANPEPWGISVHSISPPPNDDFNVTKELGLGSRAVSFNYGAIEGEPTFPMTNFGSDTAFRAGRAAAPRGVVGNAQTHCLQLANTFAFARGAKGQPIMEADYVKLAEDLIPGQGRLIVSAWKALVGEDPSAMHSVAGQVQEEAKKELRPGLLRGLLFGNAARFLTDLGLQLQFQAAMIECVATSTERVDAAKFRAFVEAAEAWQTRHGYQTVWRLPRLENVFRELNSPVINKLIAETGNVNITPQGRGATGFERLQDFYRKWDDHAPRFLAAMKDAARNL